MFDQAGMVREFVKWDYELRDGRNLADVVDRGFFKAAAMHNLPVLTVVFDNGGWGRG